MTTGGKTISILLPWSPSANEIWRSLRGTGKPYLAAKYRVYLKNVLAYYTAQGAPKFANKEPLQVALRLFPPHNRSYDIDNRIKPTLDALTRAGLWIDDRYVRKLVVTAYVPVEKGAVVVEIEPFDEERENEFVATILSWYGLKRLSPKTQKKQRKSK